MSDRSDAEPAGADRSLAQKAKRTFQNKVLVPLAATAVSAGVSYLAKKLPLILEERVLPKLRDQGAPEIANRIESVAAALPGGSSQDGDEAEQASDDGGAPQAASGTANDDREAERRAREERRRERRRALSSA
jgi:hypothetical protein